VFMPASVAFAGDGSLRRCVLKTSMHVASVI